MGIFLSTDRASYRRWVNIIPSVILPGAGHYLSNRWRAGLFWFIGFVAYTGLKFFVIASPHPHVTASPSVLGVSDCVFVASLCVDACRRPMPPCGLKCWLKLFVLAAGILLLPFLSVRQFLLQPFYIPTAGMQPTLMGATKTPDGREKRGDSIMVDKLSYRFREPRRGDIVVFRTAGLVSPGLLQNQIFVKRVAGLPGEKVSIHPPFLRIDGTNVIRPEVFEKIASSSAGYSGFVAAGRLAADGDEVVLGDDEFFVLGDNTANSFDGRYFGAIKRKSILGRVAWIFSPSERKGWPR